MSESESHPVSPVAVDCAESIVARHYGLLGTASPLAGEQDLNFRIQGPDGAAFVLKISHPAEKLTSVRSQNAALAHVAAVDPDLPVPAVILTREGAREFLVDVGGEQPRIVRLMSYLQGSMLYATPASPQQDRQLGAFLARLGLALETFSHDVMDERLLWDLRHMNRSRSMISAMVDHDSRSLVESIYDDFEHQVQGALGSLRTQTIHNDMNPYNVVIDPNDHARINGIIDFGDMVHGPLIQDIAVGAAYRWTPREHPLAGLARFLQGYATVRAVEDAELELVVDLVRARLALTITVANWQSHQFPGNRDYVLRLQDELLTAIRHCASIRRDDGRRYLQRALAAGSSCHV